jgi:hypothetical protein
LIRVGCAQVFELFHYYEEIIINLYIATSSELHFIVSISVDKEAEA